MAVTERRRTREPLDLDAEQEVEFRRYWNTVTARWWLPVLGLVAGIVGGYALALGSGDVYRAEATLYLGQPFTPNGGAPVPGLATNPSTVNEIVRNESVLREVAERSGMNLSKLRANVSSRQISPPAGRRARGRPEDDRAKRGSVGRRRRADRPHPRHARGDPLGTRAAPLRHVAVLDGKRVAVVVPARDEEALIGGTLAGIPDFVDRVYVVDDDSRDGTATRAQEAGDPRVEVISHPENEGVGAAIVTGYRRALAEGIDVACVMAGDGQMDPADLERIAAPVVRGEVDYSKANRLFTGQAWQLMPRHRYLGNAVLSMLTKIASGYWHVADSQSGYTAISRETLEQLDLDRIYPRYGFPNDMLVHLNVWNARVRDVPSRPIYGVGERSGIRLGKVIPSIAWLLLKGFFWRLREKYVIRDFHPLVLFYSLGLFLLGAGIVLG